MLREAEWRSECIKGREREQGVERERGAESAQELEGWRRIGERDCREEGKRLGAGEYGPAVPDLGDPPSP